MMGRINLRRAGAALLGAALIVAGCAKRPGMETGAAGAASEGQGKVVEEKIAKPAPIQEAPVAPEAGRGGVPGRVSPLNDVFFDYDQAVLTDDAKKGLDDNLKWLQANPRVRVTVEGHCDERGTNEYNLALGERRAKAIRAYLVAGGVDPSRIGTISYGEERPFVPGHDESAWAQNRRGHFVVPSP